MLRVYNVTSLADAQKYDMLFPTKELVGFIQGLCPHVPSYFTNYILITPPPKKKKNVSFLCLFLTTAIYTDAFDGSRTTGRPDQRGIYINRDDIVFIVYNLCSVQKVDDHHDTVTNVGHVVGGRTVAAQHQRWPSPHLRVPPDEHHRVAGAKRQPVPVSVHNRVQSDMRGHTVRDVEEHQPGARGRVPATEGGTV